jgi:hypothetical protein
MKNWIELGFDVFHMIAGPSPNFIGGQHAVVGRNGIIVHDPAPSKKGLGGTITEWQYGFLVKTCVSKIGGVSGGEARV